MSLATHESVSAKASGAARLVVVPLTKHIGAEIHHAVNQGGEHGRAAHRGVLADACLDLDKGMNFGIAYGG